MGRSTKYPRQGQGIPLYQRCSPAAAPTEGPPQMSNKQLLPPSAVSSNGRHLPTVRYLVPRQQTEAGALPLTEGKDTRQPSVGGLCNAGCGHTWGVPTQATLQMHQTDARLQTAGLSLEDVCPHRKSANRFLAPKGEHTKCSAAAGSSHHWSISNRLIKANKQALCGYLTCSK